MYVYKTPKISWLQKNEEEKFSILWLVFFAVLQIITNFVA